MSYINYRKSGIYLCWYVPNRQKGSCTGPAKEVKYKVDCGAVANIMPLSIFKMLNPSEFDKDGNSISGFNRDMTILSAYGNRPIQQHRVGMINFIFNKKYFKTRFHIVDIEATVLLELTLLRKMGLFQKAKVDDHIDHRYPPGVEKSGRVWFKGGG